jgi:hypothetical protein
MDDLHPNFIWLKLFHHCRPLFRFTPFCLQTLQTEISVSGMIYGQRDITPKKIPFIVQNREYMIMKKKLNKYNFGTDHRI